MKREENDLLIESGLSSYVSSKELSKWIHHTQGGNSSSLSEKYFKQIPCPLTTKLIAHFQMDLEMFQYDTKKYLKICKNVY